MVAVRVEAPGDREGVRAVNEAPFGRPEEAGIVEALRETDGPLISLVTFEEGIVVGYALFGPVLLRPEPFGFPAFGLAPLAALPARQRRGVGSRLVSVGFCRCRRAGAGAIFVLGTPPTTAASAL